MGEGGSTFTQAHRGSMGKPWMPAGTEAQYLLDPGCVIYDVDEIHVFGHPF